ncbi:gliding motility lipoprotein GldH [Bacteroides sp. OttesenSCG-928-E20]|nr:gliding motility lipoprotein GldH [Bacteroides sp. OttesenSCG-928-E20]MDL2305592.1 gliding motility lipoprotein GldH [Bacteroides sp. OttesenSCG-928-D19]
MSCIRRICFLWVIVLLTSCENLIMYHSYQHIAKEGWNKGDTITLTVAVRDSLAYEYDLQLLARNRFDYKYQQLTVAVSQLLNDTISLRTDTVVFNITDKNGNWLGKGIGGLYEYVEELNTLTLTSSDTLSLKIVPLTNDSILQGINDMGVIAGRKD